MTRESQRQEGSPGVGGAAGDAGVVVVVVVVAKPSAYDRGQGGGASLIISIRSCSP